MKESADVNNILESKYQSKLTNQISKYDQFLQIAKNHISQNELELTTKKEIVGHYITNDKIPLNFERGDTIGVSLANSTFTEQIEQSEEYIQSLENQNQQLLKEIEQKKEIDMKLDVYIEEINNRMKVAKEPKSELEELEKQVHDEKQRYRKLRKLLKRILEEYPDE